MVVFPEAAKAAMVIAEADAESAIVFTEANTESIVVFPEANPESTMVIPKTNAESTMVFPEADSKPTVVFPEADAESTIVFSEADTESAVVFSKADAESTMVIPETNPESTMVISIAEAKPIVVFAKANAQSTLVFSKATESTVQSEVWLFRRAVAEAPRLQLLRLVGDLILSPRATILPEHFVNVGALRLNCLVIGGVLGRRGIERIEDRVQEGVSREHLLALGGRFIDGLGLRLRRELRLRLGLQAGAVFAYRVRDGDLLLRLPQTSVLVDARLLLDRQSAGLLVTIRLLGHPYDRVILFH